MSGIPLFIIAFWFIGNMILNVVLIGREIEYTVGTAVTAVIVYPVLLWLLFQI